ncbi:chorismate-binding protein|uniref:chorismate-binding protein n=1 Tax=Noviherbaspirillum sp. L7-7A TaxID=2850560 RepID=UPI001C2BDF7A|nr:chorismate-binding protein [Noviherbaspirillum sp. L7-7A]MBV0879732.1 chorismate-binding protein [Noviherbaspirillum sp. L7-7A]
MQQECWVLLDDCNASEQAPVSRLYSGYRETLECADAAGLNAWVAQVRQALEGGRFAVLLCDYELGAGLHGIAARPEAAQRPAARALLFAQCRRLSRQEADDWLAAQAGDAPAGIAALKAAEDAQHFAAAIGRIHAWLEAGDAYQINHTWRFHFDAWGEPAALYRRLRARQPVPYGALALLPDGAAVLSLSPELFMRQEGRTLTAQPMKGTAPAAGDAALDAVTAAQMQADTKTRAENLMIVDLLRNDFGQVAETGSVKVPALFQVDRYGAVLQMTSTVSATRRADAGFAQILSALYPCGSVTGAPKRRAMQIIRELEDTPRGIYTGAIGWLDASGDFCLSVPIRTLALDAPQGGVRAGVLGVGAGIVHDSVAGDEYQECLQKARFLTGLPQEFTLFETMHATRDDGCRHLERHLARLAASARYFGFGWDGQALRAKIAAACAGLGEGEHALKLVLSFAGEATLAASPLAPWPQPVKVLLAPQPTASDALFLRHKTSLRERYDQAWRTAQEQGAFDMLFHNERGELTEGGRSNVFLLLDGHWLTPPLTAGVLPGVMRGVLLDDPAWGAREARLSMADLRRAEQVLVCNALRGALRARVVSEDA